MYSEFNCQQHKDFMKDYDTAVKEIMQSSFALTATKITSNRATPEWTASSRLHNTSIRHKHPPVQRGLILLHRKDQMHSPRNLLRQKTKPHFNCNKCATHRSAGTRMNFIFLSYSPDTDQGYQSVHPITWQGSALLAPMAFTTSSLFENEMQIKHY